MGRTGRIRLGSSVTFCEIVDTDMRQYRPSKRQFELASHNPSFRRGDLHGDAAAVRDAVQLRAEIIAPEGEDWKIYFRWILLWAEDGVHMFGPTSEDEDASSSYELSHEAASVRFRDFMDRFVHIGPMAPPMITAGPNPGGVRSPDQASQVDLHPVREGTGC